MTAPIGAGSKEKQMPIRIEEESAGKLVTIHVTGKLVKEDYADLIPGFERLVRLHGKLRVLFDMTGFHGWELGAAWEDFKFGIHHFSDIERMALVGEQRWQQAMATFAKPFTKAAVRYFDHADAAAARTWLEQA